METSPRFFLLSFAEDARTEKKGNATGDNGLGLYNDARAMFFLCRYCKMQSGRENSEVRRKKSEGKRGDRRGREKSEGKEGSQKWDGEVRRGRGKSEGEEGSQKGKGEVILIPLLNGLIERSL